MKIAGKYLRRQHWLGSGFIAAGMLLAPALASAATIVVDTTRDSLDVAGECSLRSAIEAANTRVAVGGCVAGEPGTNNVIELVGGETYKLALAPDAANNNSSGDLNLETNVTIKTTNGVRAVIDADGIDRVLSVSLSAGVTLENLEITGGVVKGDGGGIHNSGVLTLVSVLVRGNAAHGGDGDLSPGGGAGLGGALFNREGDLYLDGTIGTSPLGGRAASVRIPVAKETTAREQAVACLIMMA